MVYRLQENPSWHKRMPYLAILIACHIFACKGQKPKERVLVSRVNNPKGAAIISEPRDKGVPIGNLEFAKEFSTTEQENGYLSFLKASGQKGWVSEQSVCTIDRNALERENRRLLPVQTPELFAYNRVKAFDETRKAIERDILHNLPAARHHDLCEFDFSKMRGFTLEIEDCRKKKHHVLVILVEKYSERYGGYGNALFKIAGHDLQWLGVSPDVTGIDNAIEAIIASNGSQLDNKNCGM